MTLSPQRLLVLLSVPFFCAIHLSAQSDAGLVALNNGDYRSAFLLLTDQSERKKSAVVGHFGLAKLYAAEESSYYDLKKANDHGKTCNTLLREVKNKGEKEDLKAIGISSKSLREIREQISEQAIAKAQTENTPEALEAVLRGFRLSQEQKESLKEAYGAAVIKKVESGNSPEKANTILKSYQRELNRYSSSAYATGEAVVFKKHLAQHGWEKYDAFKSAFPDNRFSSDRGADAFMQIRNTMNITAFERFTQKYKYSAFTPIAQDSIAEFRRMLAENKEQITNNLESLSTYTDLAQFEKEYQTHLSQRIFQKEQAQLEQKLFAAFIKEQGWSEFPTFQEKHPKNRYVLDRSAKAYLVIADGEQLNQFQDFVRKYPSSHYNSFAKAEIDRLTQLRKELTEQANAALDQFKQADELYSFQEKYRSDYSKYAPGLNKKLDRQILDQFMVDHTFDDFEQFQKTYPNNAFASDRIAGSFLAVAGTGKLSHFETFIKDHAENPYRDIALDSIRYWKKYRSEFSLEVRKALEKVNSYEEAKTVDNKFQEKIGQFTPALQEQVDKKLFSSYVNENGGKNLDEFRKNHPDNKGWDPEEVKKFKETIGSNNLRQYRQFRSQYPNSVFKNIVQDSIQGIEARLKPEEKLSFSALQSKVRSDLKNKDWDAALEKIRAAGSGYTGDPDMYDDLVNLVKEPEQGLTRKEISEKINNLGSAYIPIVTADGKNLYFCATGFPDNKGLEDIFVAKKEGDGWSDPQIIDELCTSGKHEAPLSASADGNTLLLFLGGQIGYSTKTSSGWSEPKMYSSNVNMGRWQCDAIITADGKALLFTHGSGWGRDNDIYVALRQSDGSWGTARKIGGPINTEEDERTPFLHPDMKTLYFSSRGHGGMGGLDVFVSTRQDNSWDNWSEPINLGKEVNTVEEDWGYKISTDGTKAYFAAEESWSNQLFEVNLPEEFRPGQVVTIEGKVEGLDQQESATIVVLDSKTKEEVTRITSEPGTGEYFIVIPKGIEPEVKVEKEGVFSQAKKIEIETVGTEKKETPTVVQNLEVVDFNTTEVEGLSLTFEDVLFETDKYIIREELKSSLAELAGILAKKGLKTIISGYTDDVGAEDYNQTLSQKRAEAVKAYLVEMGCKTENITARGYGESNPITTNDTEQGRAKNRRVEFSFEE